MKQVLYILGQLTDCDVDWLTEVGDKTRYPEHSLLIERDQPSDYLFIVLSGSFTVETRFGAVRNLGRGEMLGEISFVDTRPPSADVRAAEDSLVLAIPRKALEVRLHEDVGFAARFYRAIAVFLAHRLRHWTSQLGSGETPRGGERNDADELDENVLDNVHLAGSRFERMMKRLVAE